MKISDMKIISVLQPWATLIVTGAKLIETRSWDTKHRGPLGIHASKKMTREQKALCETEPFRTYLASIDELPLGMIIGSVTLDSTFRTEEFPKAMVYRSPDYGPTTAHTIARGTVEKQFGDYSPGRFGWHLRNAKAFAYAFHVMGSLGLWDLRICRECGCWDHDCRGCIEKTGEPCSWVEDDLCSACI